MHQGCDGGFGGGTEVVDKLRKMGFSAMAMPVEAKVNCVECDTSFMMVTLEQSCPQCGMVYGVTPCHSTDPSGIKAAGVGY